MGRLALVQKVEPTIEPEIRANLDATLATYAGLKAQRDLLQEQMDAEKKVVGLLLEEAGVKTIKVGGLTARLVEGGVTRKIDKLKLEARGLTQEDVTTARPKKSYLDIRGEGDAVPGVDE